MLIHMPTPRIKFLVLRRRGSLWGWKECWKKHGLQMIVFFFVFFFGQDAVFVITGRVLEFLGWRLNDQIGMTIYFCSTCGAV